MKAKKIEKGIYEIGPYRIENMMITMQGCEVDQQIPWRITRDGEWVIDTNTLWYAKELIQNWENNNV